MRWLALVLLVAGCDRVWFIDKLPAPADGGPDAAPGCPSYFTYSPTTKSSYFYSDDAAVWSVTRDACRARSEPGATGFVHLAVVTDRTEYTIVRGIAGTAAWVGIFDPVAADTNVQYRGVTREPLPTDLPWGTGLPDFPDVQTCVRVFMADGLDDDVCTSPQPAVCECDAYIDDGS